MSLLVLCFSAYGQTEKQTEKQTEGVEIFFYHNKYDINLDFEQNRATFKHLFDFINKIESDTLLTLSKIEIDSYTSPEGGKHLNDKLSINRTHSMYEYFSKEVSLPDSLITIKNSATDWVGLRELVESSDMKYADEVIEILDNVPEETWKRVNPNDRWLTLVDSRNKHLADLRGGEVYRYMFSNVYPKLRRGSVVTVYFKSIIPPVVAEPVKAIEPEPEVVAVVPTPAPVVEPVPVIEYERKPLFAVKTNLLFDLATVLNISLEVPLGQRFSLSGEWTFPWWTWDDGTPSSKRHRLQLLYGNLEGRYWFGSRDDRPILTGWYAGLYTGGGKYDFEYDRKGVQGEFFVAAGATAGFAHSINKKNTLRMEYSLSAGVLKTDFRDYTAIYADGYDFKWHPIRKSTGEYTYFGPTSVRVSLVWMLYYNKQKKGATK